MKKNENIKTLAEKYKEIFQKEVYDFNRGGPVDRHLVGFLIEFAGAIEHHLSSERAVEVSRRSECLVCGKTLSLICSKCKKPPVSTTTAT